MKTPRRGWRSALLASTLVTLVVAVLVPAAAVAAPARSQLAAAPPVRVWLNKTAFTVGDEAQYTVTGPPGAPIFWSSSKNGVSTGEHYSFYGHYLDANGMWSTWAGTWPASAVGSWVKYVHVGTQTLQAAQVAFTVSARPVAVSTDRTRYRVGEYMTYVVTGPPNTPIYWSSWRNGASTGEVTAFYSHHTDADGRFTASGVGPWSAASIGFWIKQVSVGGQTAQVAFDVVP